MKHSFTQKSTTHYVRFNLLSFFLLIILGPISLLIAQNTPDVYQLGFFMGKGNFSIGATPFLMQAQGTIWTVDNITSSYDQDELFVLNNTQMEDFLGLKTGWSHYIQNPTYHPIAFSIYKLSNITPNFSDYFYIDTRDCGWGYGITPGYLPDTYFYCQRIDATHSQFYYRTTSMSQWQSINNGEILNIWDIHNKARNTSCFVDFSSHNFSLSLSSYNNRPKLIWVYHPIEEYKEYKIYRYVTPLHAAPNPSLYTLIANVSEDDNSYVDYDFTIGGSNLNAYYYVKVNINANAQPISNIVNTNVQLYKSEAEMNDDISPSQLLSVYPNPFNAIANIKYFIEKPSDIKIEVYNYIGQKTATLINNFHNIGEYNIQFNGSDYSSGLYFIHIISEHFI